MSFLALLKRDVVLLHRAPGTPDEYGDPVPDVSEQPAKAELQLVGSRDELNSNVQLTTWRLFLPPDAPARGWDAVRLEDGSELELAGDAWLATNPRTGEPHHVEAYLEGAE